MIQDVAALLKIGFEYFVHIISGLFVGSVIFLGYAKLKTGGSWQETFSVYVDVLIKSILFTAVLLVSVFVLTHYVSILYIGAGLLLVSSLLILSKHLYMPQARTVLLIDGCVVLVNAYFSYLLIMHDQMSIDHYIMLGIAGFSFFVYQQIKKI